MFRKVSGQALNDRAGSEVRPEIGIPGQVLTREYLEVSGAGFEPRVSG